jgi:hypothetical protein
MRRHFCTNTWEIQLPYRRKQILRNALDVAFLVSLVIMPSIGKLTLALR